MPKVTIKKRDGVKLLYSSKYNEEWKIVGYRIVVVSPDNPPKVIHPNGSIEELKPCPPKP